MAVNSEPGYLPFPLDWDGCTCPACGEGEDESAPLRYVEKIEQTFQVGRRSLTEPFVMVVDVASQNPDESGPARIECQACWSTWAVPAIEWES